MYVPYLGIDRGESRQYYVASIERVQFVEVHFNASFCNLDELFNIWPVSNLINTLRS